MIADPATTTTAATMSATHVTAAHVTSHHTTWTTASSVHRWGTWQHNGKCRPQGMGEEKRRDINVELRYPLKHVESYTQVHRSRVLHNASVTTPILIVTSTIVTNDDQNVMGQNT